MDEEPRSHKHEDKGAADLERVTDFVEEKELAVSGVKNLPSLMAASENGKGVDGMMKLRKEDIELIVNELEVPKIIAEKKLREHRGNVKLAIKAILGL